MPDMIDEVRAWAAPEAARRAQVLEALRGQLDTTRFPDLGGVLRAPERFARRGHRVFYDLNKALSRGRAGAGADALRDKLLFGGFLRAIGAPTPEAVALATPETLTLLAERRVLPLDEGLARLDGRLFVKARFGSQGKGAFALELGGGRARIDGAAASPKQLAKRLGALGPREALIERAIVQHPSMAELNAASLNTVRMLTSTLNGPAHVVAATQRMGRAASVVDNAASGGVFARIDPARGCMTGEARSKDGDAHPRHPDSGVVFEGRAIPLFRAAAELCCYAHAAFGQLPTIGWDVAIGPDGPLLVEGNGYWDASLHRVFAEDFLWDLGAELAEAGLLARRSRKGAGGVTPD